MKTKLILVTIIFLGFFLRWHNISPFKIYPDSYQNLLVGENIMTYHSVLGYLGPQGMLYPDIFMWTRPGYALLINSVTFFTNNMTLSAQLIAFGTAIITILISYLLIKTILKSSAYALAGATLLALSFNHTVWSGFIMTETTGILFLLLFLRSLFRNIKSKQVLFPDFVTGFLFACAVLTRYEYAILAIPFIFIIFRQSPQPIIHLVTIISAFFLTLSLTVLTLIPLESVFSVIGNQLHDILLLTGIFVGIFIFGIAINKIIPKKYKKYFTSFLYKIFPALILLCALLLVAFVGGIREFFTNDILLSIFSVFGIIFMIRKKEFQNYVFFVLFSVICLGFLYHHTNPDMERYITHLIPLLLIPASYGLVLLVNKKKPFILLIPMALLMVQIFISYHGLKASQNPEWFRIAYEEKAANMIKEYIPNRNDKLFIVSLPEPYYYNLQASTYSLNDTYPFISITDALDQKTVFVVSDMPMHTIFPKFSKFVENNLQKYKMTQFWVKERYLYTDATYEEKYPVVIYKLSLRELKTQITSSQ